LYLEYWGLRKLPFDNVPDRNFFYEPKAHKEGLMRLPFDTVDDRPKGATNKWPFWSLG